MKQFLIAFVLVYCAQLQSQVLQVIDKTTRQTVPGAVVYSPNGKLSAVSNALGQLDFSKFKGLDSIYINLVGYVPVLTSAAAIEKNKYLVELNEGAVSLSEITVSANRNDENILEIPNRIEKLNMKEVAFQNPQTTADLLGTSGYAYIQKSQLGGGSPMLRGMATNRVLLVVDGVRMNTAIFRSGNLQNVISLDANALESTEILFGPGSVMYGSDAIGGVMSFGTIKPKFADTSSSCKLWGNALLRTSSANAEQTGHLDVNLGFKRLSFLVSFTHSKYGDLRSGSVGGVNYFYRPNYVQTVDNKDYILQNPDSTLQVGSKYSQRNFMSKLSYKATNYLSVDYGLHYSETSPYNRYDRLYVVQTSGPNKNKLRYAEWYYGPQKWNMNQFSLTHNRKNALYSHLKLIVALQHFEESRYDREFMSPIRRMQKETVRALSINIDLEKKLNARWSLQYGAEALHNKVGSTASLTQITTNEAQGSVTRYPDGCSWQSYGAYLSSKYQVAKHLIFSVGARYSYYKILADFDTAFFAFPFSNTKMSNGNLNGSLGFVYTVNRSWQLYTNAATGFRAPNIDDMGKVFESTPGFLVVPNPNLKPESAYSVELGTVKSFKRFMKLDAAAYYTLIDDAMERMNYTFNGQSTIFYEGNNSTVQAVQNVTKAYVYGLQAGVDMFYKGLGLKSTFSFQRGKEQSGDSLVYYPLRHAAPAFGSTHLTYQMKRFKYDFYVVYNGRMDYEDLALTERVNASYARDYSIDPKGKPYSAGWYTLNFKVGYYPTKDLAITIGVENIADLLYRPYSSGINAPGRNFILALKYRIPQPKTSQKPTVKGI